MEKMATFVMNFTDIPTYLIKDTITYNYNKTC